MLTLHAERRNAKTICHLDLEFIVIVPLPELALNVFFTNPYHTATRPKLTSSGGMSFQTVLLPRGAVATKCAQSESPGSIDTTTRNNLSESSLGILSKVDDRKRCQHSGLLEVEFFLLVSIPIGEDVICRTDQSLGLG